ncbi:MAG: hydrogenase expression/formation protein HypE [Bacteroidales bacterium]|nr:hydrogenase expression/formation protein HypE [Bacteroidales bacterium]MCF8336343.1 hydrogenase expression/formation protein HypE [Bacteroidales bacterium]
MANKIEIGHGSGGLMTQELIQELFMKYFDNQWLKAEGDSAIVDSTHQKIAFTTDSYVINPLFFPGGDLGKLAVCGTVNDLAVTGARPSYLTAGFIIEEGLSLETLENIVKSMKAEADKAGVHIVAGDTKVVEKGQADRLFINTSGMGFVDELHKNLANGKLITEGDRVWVNGTLGDHEAAIMNAREAYFENSRLESDCASLNGLIRELLDRCNTIRFIRDITRGGLAGILHEVAGMSSLGFEINEDKIPISEGVQAFCESLGYEPLHMACEGKCIVIADESEAERVASIMKNHEFGKNAAQIGQITKEHPGDVVLDTMIGGRRLLEPPRAAKVPRIC